MIVKENFVLSYDMGCGEPVKWISDGVYHELSKDEAVSKYGDITDIKRGPRGGFKSVTFGDRMFLTNVHGL